MSWYKVTFSIEEMSAGRHIELQEQFSKLFMLWAGRKDAAMFASRDVLENVYYFSPGAALIAEHLIRSYSGTECSAPARASVKPVVVGNDLDSVPF